jgi:transcriptional regulator with XRE-family HTH domain
MRKWGAAAGAVASAAGPFMETGSLAGNTAAHAVVGGLASVAGGGKFANGAETAAFGHLFNACGGRNGCAILGGGVGTAVGIGAAGACDYASAAACIAANGPTVGAFGAAGVSSPPLVQLRARGGPDHTMTSLRHRMIEQRRQQLGIGLEDFARQIGVSASEYRDVESYDDELTMVLPLKSARSLAAILGFELGTLFGAGSPTAGQNASNKLRHVILAEARQRLGVSPKKMADEIGFEEVFVHTIENDSQALETYPYEVLKIVANYLKLDPQDLLYAPSA